MSQHWLTTDSKHGKATILSGWDRPLSGYFLVVESVSDPENILYSNLDEPNSHPQEFNRFDAVLASLGISMPAQMRQEILADKESNTGNKIVRHAVRGGAYFRNGEPA